MVLFTVNNMSSPTSSYHITTETPLADASGILQNASVLTLTLPVNVPIGTTPSYTSIATNIHGTIATSYLATTALSTSGVTLNMSDGTTNTIFDSVYTGLNTLEFMMSRNQYYLMASDDVMLINVDGVKLLLIETTFANQK